MANIERLKQLRRVVEAAPVERFDMDVVNKRDCGSAHCAWGWAYWDPWFIENTEIREPGSGFDDSPGVFSLDVCDARDLFNPPGDCDGNRSGIKDEVLANIDRLIAGEYAIPYDDSYDNEYDD